MQKKYINSGSLKLILVKTLHTLIWIFFNILIFYTLWAVIVNRIDKWVWICVGFVCFEGLVLAVFKFRCPLTLVARKYTDSEKDNFDIYIPNWLARHNKLIYTSIFAISLMILFYRIL